MDKEYEADFFELLLKENNSIQYFIISPTENTQIEKSINTANKLGKKLPKITAHIILCGSKIPESNKPIVTDFSNYIN